jgi:hypothetical protein
MTYAKKTSSGIRIVLRKVPAFDSGQISIRSDLEGMRLLLAVQRSVLGIICAEIYYLLPGRK